MGTRGFSLGVKWPGHEVGNSPQFSAEVKTEWSYTSTPPMLSYKKKAQGQLYLHLYMYLVLITRHLYIINIICYTYPHMEQTVQFCQIQDYVTTVSHVHI